MVYAYAQPTLKSPTGKITFFQPRTDSIILPPLPAQDVQKEDPPVLPSLLAQPPTPIDEPSSAILDYSPEDKGLSDPLGDEKRPTEVKGQEVVVDAQRERVEAKQVKMSTLSIGLTLMSIAVALAYVPFFSSVE